MARRRFWLIAFFSAAVVLLVCVANALARTKKHPPAKPIDLNAATLSQLEELPGIGPVTAKAIVDFRTKSGPFRRVEDLLAIHRISRKKLEKLRPYVMVRPVEKTRSSRRRSKSARASH